MKDNVFIGANATILANVTIGSNVIIAAGSLVVNDVSDGNIVGGVPAKVIGDVNDFSTKRKYYSKTPLGKMEGNEMIEYLWDNK